jgi:hypothetical protein
MRQLNLRVEHPGWKATCSSEARTLSEPGTGDGFTSRFVNLIVNSHLIVNNFFNRKVIF